MKSLKKTLVLLVVFAMIFATIAPAFAATDVAGLDCEDQVTRMEALGIINGFEDGSFKPEETITRAQMAKIICLMTGVTETLADASKNADSKFSDVKAGEWYTGYVNIASNNGIIAGFPDGTFRPNETLTMNQVLTLCVKALGRGGYVDKMGTWPANYVTEAARLNLLKNVKGSSVANRGNVAIIGWNTLGANTWSVASEDLDGKVTLGVGEEAKTLLAINFNDFVTEGGDFKELEGIEITAGEIADTDAQLELTLEDLVGLDEDDQAKFVKDYGFVKKPAKNSDEKSYKSTDGTKVIVYVPEEVCEDLDDLVGKTITLILGEDNVAALILIEDDISEKDMLTAYDYAKGKITVGGTKYTLSEDGYTITLNDSDAGADIGATLLKLGLAEDAMSDVEDIEKAIEATVTLNDEDDVKAIDLFVSATIDDVSIEALVLKVRETSSTYKITTTEGVIEWDIENEEDEEFEFPKVYVDGVKGDIRDIEAGNVITVFAPIDALEDLDDVDIENEEITKIYASTETVVGEATKITKSNNAIRVDGKSYLPSFEVEGVKVMTTEELSKATTDGDWDAYDPDTILDNEEVTLYLNIFGEYVAISLDEVSSDYTFGVVTYVATTPTNSGDEEEYEELKIRVRLPDDSKKYFTLSLDTSDEDLMEELDGEGIESVVDFAGVFAVGNFVMFEAASGVITVEDAAPVVKVEATLGTIPGTDYVVAALAGKIDEEEFNAVIEVTDATTYSAEEEYYVLDGGMYVKQTVADQDALELLTNPVTLTDVIDAEYDSAETVIFNTAKKEVVSKWESILNDDEDGFSEDAVGTTFMIFEDDEEDVPMFVVTNLGAYTSSDAVYAIGGEDEVYQEGDKDYADLLGTEGIEFTGTASPKEVVYGWLVEYSMSSSKASSAYSIIDIDEFKTARKGTTEVEDVTNFTDRDDGAGEVLPDTGLKAGFSKDNKLEAIELANIKTRTEKYKLEFVEIDDRAIADVEVSDDVIVYDLRTANKVITTDIEKIQEELLDADDPIYAIPCTNGTDDIIFIL